MILRRTLFTLTLALSALLVQACSRPQSPQPSCNFVENPESQRVSWKRKLPINLYLHNSVPTDAYPAISKAVSEYNAKMGNGQEIFHIVGWVGGTLNPVQDGYSTIYWFTSWDGSSDEQARTTIYWMGNEIFEADMRINAAGFSYSKEENVNSTEVDLQSLVTHELGHMLGLAHNPTAGSVMNFSLAKGVERRTLGAVDLASLKCEY